MRCLFGGKTDWSEYTTYERWYKLGKNVSKPDAAGKRPPHDEHRVVYVCKKHQPLTGKQVTKLEKALGRTAA